MRDALHFGPKTFAYFDGARKHAADRAWFDEHSSLYTESVEVPLAHLVNQLGIHLAPSLPGVAFSERKITKPLLRKAADDGSVLRENATAFFSEKATSMFETNPGVYLSFGAKPDDNVIGCGLYMPSARQLRELRAHFGPEAGVLRSILAAQSLREHWGGLSGDRYTRLPKGFDETAPGSEYLWHKQFFLGKQFSREQACAPSFIDNAVESFTAALPFLTWTRNTVGVYRKPTKNEES